MNARKLFVSFVLLLCLTCAAHAQTQLDEHRFEVGALYTALNFKTFDETINGLGGRLGYNFNDHFALDAEASFFPEQHLRNNQFGQKGQAFLGVKAGARSKYVGAFAKLRPGVMFIGEFTTGFDCSRNGAVTRCQPEHHNFALDAGGVVEFYPSARSIIRLDAGDTIIRERQTTFGFFNPSTTTGQTTHNFQVSVGFSYRF
jgi:Outer membrane protein beta-barrel domain